MEKRCPPVPKAQAPNFSVNCSVWFQALILGVPAGLLELFSGRFVLCLAVLVGSCFAMLVLTGAGF